MNAADYTVWLAQFGTDPAASAGVSVASAATSAVAISPVGLPSSNPPTAASRTVASETQPSVSHLGTRLDWRRLAYRTPDAEAELATANVRPCSEPEELDTALADWPELMTLALS